MNLLFFLVVLIRVDLFQLAHFWTLRAFLPGMVKRNRGVVVTISSAGGIVGTNGLADYSASKFAVYGMDEALRLDLRKAGSKVHTLCVTPFYINTGLFDGVKVGRFVWRRCLVL